MRYLSVSQPQEILGKTRIKNVGLNVCYVFWPLFVQKASVLGSILLVTNKLSVTCSALLNFCKTPRLSERKVKRCEVFYIVYILINMFFPLKLPKFHEVLYGPTHRRQSELFLVTGAELTDISCG